MRVLQRLAWMLCVLVLIVPAVLGVPIAYVIGGNRAMEKWIDFASYYLNRFEPQ